LVARRQFFQGRDGLDLRIGTDLTPDIKFHRLPLLSFEPSPNESIDSLDRLCHRNEPCIANYGM
jgi:hypothetical protein